MKKFTSIGWADLLLGVTFLVIGIFTLTRPLEVALISVVAYGLV